MSSLLKAPALQSNIIVDSGTKTATANGTGVDISSLEGLIAFSVFVGVTSGTPSDTITIETSDAVGGTYAAGVKSDGTAATMSAVTATGGTARIVCDSNALKAFVRAAHVISGGTPSLSLVVAATGAVKYQ